MEFPSIKLNIFKKLEYFLILKTLNKQFDDQFKALKTREFINGEFGKDNLKSEFVRYVYPTWEVEKKILFWSYSSHKLLNHEIDDQHFKGMLISDKEKNYANNKDSIFQNLEMRDFGKFKEGRRISKNGLAFGELLWYLYKPTKSDEIGLFGKMPKIYRFFCKQKGDFNESRSYLKIFGTNYILNRISFGWFILQLQLISLHLFLIYGIALFSLEIIKIIGLLDDLHRYLYWLRNDSIWLIFIIFLPLIIFTGSFIADLIYRWAVVDNRYEKVERLLNLIDQ